MPKTFLAHAFDLGDPWQSNGCVTMGCCVESKEYNRTKVNKTRLFEPFIYKNDHFAKTGSGQT
jgi:hypothetical protein